MIWRDSGRTFSEAGIQASGRMGLPEFFRLGEDGSDKKYSQGLFLCDRIGIWINKKKK